MFSPTPVLRPTKLPLWRLSSRAILSRYELDAGGHLTHGAKPNQSGKWFNAIHYGVRKQDGRIDFEQVDALAKEHEPAESRWWVCLQP